MGVPDRSNKSRDWIRRRRARRKATARAAADPPDAAEPARDKARAGAASGPGGFAERSDERIGRLLAALRRMPGQPREILTMFYLEELSVREIADALGIPPGTVKSRLYHAREALRETLEEEER